MPPEGACLNPESCSAIILLRNNSEKIHEDYERSQKSLTQNTVELTLTNNNLIKLSSDVQYLCTTFDKSDKHNEIEHNVFFSRLREEETKRIEDIGKVKTSQATKITTGDLLKMITAFLGAGSFLIMLFKYIKVL